MGSDSGECWCRIFTFTCFGHQSRFVGTEAPWLNGHLASGKVFLFLVSGETLPDEVASVFSICFLPSNMIRHCVKKLLFGAAAPAEAENLDQRLRQIEAIRQVPG